MGTCLNCGSEIKQLPKKRKKIFCDSTCRSNYWQKSSRLETKGLSNDDIIKEIKKTHKTFAEKVDTKLSESPKKSELSDFWKQRMAKKLGIK